MKRADELGQLADAARSLHRFLSDTGTQLSATGQPPQSLAGPVLSIGAHLGIGAEKVMVPLNELSLRDDRLVWETSRT